jgi:hypothetical protein
MKECRPPGSGAEKPSRRSLWMKSRRLQGNQLGTRGRLRARLPAAVEINPAENRQRVAVT